MEIKKGLCLPRWSIGNPSSGTMVRRSAGEPCCRCWGGRKQIKFKRNQRTVRWKHPKIPILSGTGCWPAALLQFQEENNKRHRQPLVCQEDGALIVRNKRKPLIGQGFHFSHEQPVGICGISWEKPKLLLGRHVRWATGRQVPSVPYWLSHLHEPSWASSA